MSKCKCGTEARFPGLVRAQVNDFTRIITFQAGYRCTETGDHSHGVSGVDMLWLLKNRFGAVQFMTMTGWYPVTGNNLIGEKATVLPADLGYHSLKPMYEGQDSRDDCPWLDGKPCYYDGSGLNARTPFMLLTTVGEEAVWKYLEEYHVSTFGQLHELELEELLVASHDARALADSPLPLSDLAEEAGYLALASHLRSIA